MNILFDCTGNQCRSVMGEYLLRDMLAKRGLTGVETSSAGTLRYPPQPADPQTVRVLAADGIDASAHRSTPLDANLTRAADLILCFEKDHIDAIAGLNPLAARKTFLFEDFVNACRQLSSDGGVAGATPDEKLDEIVADIPMIRPFLPIAVQTEDPHRKSETVFVRVHDEIRRGLDVILGALA